MEENKKLKIGILTFWWSNDNYGQLLQCYALQKYLRDAGHDAYLIRYDFRPDISKNPFILRCLKALNPFKLIKFISHKKHELKVISEQTKNDRHFDDFRSKYIENSEKIYLHYSELESNPPEADVYIVGSDQVWNFSFYKDISRCWNLLHAYFLDFGKAETKRISYAASWSCTDLPEEIIKEIRPLLSKFNYVSVREKSGIDMCRKCEYENAELVPDPTLLLDSNDYRKLYRENNVQKSGKPYLLLYMLGNECDFDIQTAYDFAASMNLDVVYVTGNSKIDKYKKTYATIPEWLCLVDNAEYVITNSFHCCVFSLIFNKQFAAVPVSGSISSMNTRLDSLFESAGIKARWLDRDFSVLDEKYSPAFKMDRKFDIEEALNA